MKKLLFFSFFVLLFSLFFIKSAPSSFAATITCGPDLTFGETWTCNINCGGTGGCFQTQACGSTFGTCRTITATKNQLCGPTCTSDGCWTCASLGYQCGTLVNNCGQTLKCGNNGACTDTTKTCSSNKCVAPACQTCASLGYQCGTLVNNCGQTLKCGNNGACTDTTKTCSNNQCGTSCWTCASLGYQCGTLVNNCGQTLKCGNNGGCSDGTKTCSSNKCVTPTGANIGQFTVGCGSGLNSVWTLDCIFPKIGTAINWLLLFSGLVAIVLIIVSGIWFITSSGDPKKIEDARRTFAFALLGLFLIFLSFTIIRFLAEFTGVACIDPIKTMSFTSCI